MHPHIRGYHPFDKFFIPQTLYFYATWREIAYLSKMHLNQPLCLLLLCFNYRSQWKIVHKELPILTWIPHNESKICHMTFQDLVNTICSSSSNYIHGKSMTVYIIGMITSHAKMFELLKFSWENRYVRE